MFQPSPGGQPGREPIRTCNSSLMRLHPFVPLSLHKTQLVLWCLWKYFVFIQTQKTTTVISAHLPRRYPVLRRLCTSAALYRMVSELFQLPARVLAHYACLSRPGRQLKVLGARQPAGNLTGQRTVKWSENIPLASWLPGPSHPYF